MMKSKVVALLVFVAHRLGPQPPRFAASLLPTVGQILNKSHLGFSTLDSTRIKPIQV